MDCDKVNLINTKAEMSSFGIVQESLVKDVRIEDVKKQVLCEKNESGKTGRVIKAQNNEATEERQRTGRYLAIGVTLIMLFIAFYHTLLRHATVLAGLLAPAIIMLLYILWLFYFAKKKKTPVSSV